MEISLHHVGIVASQPAQSIAFYACLFAGHSTQQAGHTLLSTNSLKIAIVPLSPKDPPRPARGYHLAFAWPLSQKEVLLQRLQRLDCPYQETQQRLYTCDPDGLTLEFLFIEDESL